MKYTNSQKRSIGTREPITLCVAGPGSGKSTTLAARANALAKRGFVAITFTQEGARSLKRKISNQTKCFIGTLHSYCLMWIMRCHDDLGYTAPPIVIDEEGLREVIHEIGGKKYPIDDIIKLLNKPIRHNPSPSQMLAIRVLNHLRANNLITYDQILTDFLKLLGKREINCGHLLVDEYQDSGAVDHEIYHRLKAETKFFVGDPDQSIYAFRGGKIQNIMEISREAEVILMEESFRCPRLIRTASMNLIRNNELRIDKVIAGTDDRVGLLDFKTFPDQESEIEWIKKDIQLLLKAEHEPSEIAVLCRTNHIVNQYTEELTWAGIPLSFTSKASLQRPVGWRAGMAALSFLANPQNDFLAMRYLDAVGTSKKDIQKLERSAKMRRTTIADAWFNGRFNGLEVSGFHKALNTMKVPSQTLRVLGQKYQEAKPKTFQEFILFLKEGEEEVKLEDGVRVLTVHRAKGLEFKQVYLPRLDSETFPIKRADVDEERRLMYVGLTRAKVCCSVSCPLKIKYYGAEKRVEPSIFINEMKGE